MAYINVDSNIVEESGCIGANLPRKFTRIATENKNMLQKKGAIYVGTGEMMSVSIEGNDESYSAIIAKTVSSGDETGCFKNNGIGGATSPDPVGNSTYALKLKTDGSGNFTVFWVKE